MDELRQLADVVNDTLHAIGRELTSVRLMTQLMLILGAGAVSALAANLVRARADLNTLAVGWPPFVQKLARLLLANLGAILFVLVAALIRVALITLDFINHGYLLRVAISLATAWAVIAVVAGLIRNRFVYRLVAVSAWTVAALSIVGLLTPIASGLDSVSFVIGGLRVSPLLAIKTSVLLAVTLWAANAAGDFLDRRVRSATDLTPSIQVLIGKVLRLVLITFAILVVMSTVGIDLSALAFFSGAVGVGLGFGLQKIVSNLVSGIILLADKSIKPGDVISVGEHFGRVSNMGARYTSVDTRDGREYLIPNEDFITQRVANWTYSNDLVGLCVNFNTTYDSDPHMSQSAAVEIALGVNRVLKSPAPACMLSKFGPLAIEFELWFWINDPAAGIANVKSDVLLALWDMLGKHAVSIAKPGPARVIYERAGDATPQADGLPAKSTFPP